MPDSSQATYTGLPACGTQLFIVLFALSTAALAYAGGLPAVVVRFLFVTAVTLQLAQHFSNRDGSFLISPGFIFAAVIGLGYSVIPSFVVFIMENRYLPSFVLDAFITIISTPAWLAYFGHQSELFVLAFASALLAVHGITQIISAHRARPEALKISSLTEQVLAGTSLALTMLTVSTPMIENKSIAIGHIASTAAPPLQAIILLILTHQNLTKRDNLLRFLVVMFAAVACMLWQYQAKIPFFVILAIGVYTVYIRSISIKRIFALIAIVIFFFVLMMQISQTLRNAGPSLTNDRFPALNIMVEVVYSKAIWRQIGTGNCFREVVEQHVDRPFLNGDHLFWLRALIPRIFWPQKENFSLGSKYEVQYCGGLAESRHSASITVLGQPVIKTGATGLLFHAGILLFGIGVLSWLSLRSAGLGAVYVMSLLPWWIDFDQDFALYVAHIVKFSIIMGIVMLPVAFIEKQDRISPDIQR